MVARTELSPTLEQFRRGVWPLTAYEKNSRTRNWEYPFVMSQIAEFVRVNRIPSLSELSILEMCATNSCLQFYYAGKGAKYTSVEESPTSYDASLGHRLNAEIGHIVGRFEEVRIKDRYDLFLSVSVMEHARKGKERRIIQNISEAFKSRGRAIVTLDWFFDHRIGETCIWGYNPDYRNLVRLAEEMGLALVVGDTKCLSGYPEFNERELKRDAFVMKVCNRGVWLTSLAFVLEKTA